jgi:outer membrane protein OmpA-like peptidoglycan-associated protein
MQLKSIIASLGMLMLLGACASTSGDESMAGSTSASIPVAYNQDSYVVYFRYNSTRLTGESEGTLFDAMQAIRMKKAKSVKVVAYMDSKGSKRRNKQLAVRRGKLLKSRLAESGAKTIEVIDGGVLNEKSSRKTRRAKIQIGM